MRRKHTAPAANAIAELLIKQTREALSALSVWDDEDGEWLYGMEETLDSIASCLAEMANFYLEHKVDENLKKKRWRNRYKPIKAEVIGLSDVLEKIERWEMVSSSIQDISLKETGTAAAELTAYAKSFDYGACTLSTSELAEADECRSQIYDNVDLLINFFESNLTVESRDNGQ